MIAIQAMALKQVCKAAGCPASVPFGTRWCARHAVTGPARDLESERKRRRDTVKTPAQYERSRLYATAAWQRMRLAVLNEEPLCRTCAADGRVEAATLVDHIRPHRGDLAVFTDRTNLQPMCGQCHASKSAAEGHEERALAAGRG